MSTRRSRSRQPPSPLPALSRQPTEARLAAAPGANAAPDARPSKPLLVPLLLALLLGCVLAVLLTGTHLASAAGLTRWLTPSPLPPLSPMHLGKLLVHAGLAALAAGSLLLIRQIAQRRVDRRLTSGFAWLLLPGGALYVGLDLAPAFGVREPWVGHAENVVKWVVIGGCGLLLGRRLLQRRHPTGDAPSG